MRYYRRGAHVYIDKRNMLLVKRGLLFCILSGTISSISCLILRNFGLEILMICGAVGMAFVFIWVACWLDDKDKLDTSKILIFILVYIGVMMAGFSYYLAYIEREEIAESLSKAALIELVAPPIMLLMKSLVENLSMNNNWPDKPACKDENPPI